VATPGAAALPLTEGRLPPIIRPVRTQVYFTMRIKKFVLFTLGVLAVIAAFFSVKKLRK
jgi:hypothetical protein